MKEYQPYQAAGRPRRTARLLALALVTAVAVGCGTIDTGEPAPDGFYRVRQGDTLYSVARSHKRSVQDLAQWNAIPDADRIESGQLLRIRPPSPAVASGAGASGGVAGSSGGAPATTAKSGTAKPAGTASARSQAPAAAKPAKAIALQWPADGKVTGKFAPPGSKGVRIATTGGVVKAAAGGRAIHVGMLRGYGMLVILKHGEDWLTVYGNLGKPTIKEGAQVATGQEVGRMGAGATELHFEVRGNGKPVDPLSMLPARS